MADRLTEVRLDLAGGWVDRTPLLEWAATAQPRGSVMLVTLQSARFGHHATRVALEATTESGRSLVIANIVRLPPAQRPRRSPGGAPRPSGQGEPAWPRGPLRTDTDRQPLGRNAGVRGRVPALPRRPGGTHGSGTRARPQGLRQAHPGPERQHAVPCVTSAMGRPAHNRSRPATAPAGTRIHRPGGIVM